MFQMPRKYIRKTDKAKWTAEDLKKAKAAITIKIRKIETADQSKIPFNTLQDSMKSGTDYYPRLGRKCVFPPAHEAANELKQLS